MQDFEESGLKEQWPRKRTDVAYKSVSKAENWTPTPHCEVALYVLG